MAFDSNQESFQELLKIILSNERRVVPFIGAGLSIYGLEPERLPHWRQLIERLISKGRENGTVSETNKNEIRKELDQGRYILATDLLIKYLGEANFRIFLERELNTQNKEIPPTIAQIICISWSLMVTTNLDKFIEEAWQAKFYSNLEVLTNRDVLRLTKAISIGSSENSATLLKVHGSIESYESWILNTNQYKLLLEQEDYVFALRHLFTKTLFFVGYGLNDADLDVLLLHLKTLFPAGVGSYFALLDDRHKSNDQTRQVIRDHGVQPIWYRYKEENKYKKDSGHGEVLECIQVLVKEWLNKSSLSNATLKYFPELEPGFVGRTNELNILRQSLITTSTSTQIIGFGGEGKTSLIQYLLQTQEADLSEKFSFIFGFSFYHGDVGKFINDAYNTLTDQYEPIGVREKVNYIKGVLNKKNGLLILDGLEVEQLRNGEIKNHFLEELIDVAVGGISSLIITSRIPTSKNIQLLQLGPLSQDDTDLLLMNWQIDSSNYFIRRLIKEQIGRHALSLRVLAGFIKEDKTKALGYLESLSFHEIKDEADFLKANKVSRILKHYETIIGNDLLSFMRCFSVFYNPVHINVVLHCFVMDFGESSPNKCLLNKDLRVIIWRLLKLRLLILESDDLLTTHPTIREYFNEVQDQNKLKPLHHAIAQFYNNNLKNEQPKDFQDALKYFDLCYHAAKAEDWTLYDYYYDHVINRSNNYLGYTMEAWEENIYLAKLAFPNQDISRIPVIRPIHYLTSIARSLKHLGQVKTSKSVYKNCLKLCIKTSEEQTARLVNNLLTLLITSGDLNHALSLFKFNFSTLKWNQDKEFRDWQYEHALCSGAYLFYLVGNRDLAKVFFESYSTILKNKARSKKWQYFYHNLFYVDLMLTGESDQFSEALSWIERHMGIAKENNWHETIVLSYRCLSFLSRAKYIQAGGTGNLNDARGFVQKGITLTDLYFMPRFQIEIWLEYLRLEYLLLKETTTETKLDSFRDTIQSVREVIERLGFFLYLPEVLALEGWYNHFLGNSKESENLCQEALDYASKIGFQGIGNSEMFALGALVEIHNFNQYLRAEQRLKLLDPNDLINVVTDVSELEEVLNNLN